MNEQNRICVTGASGYIASHITGQLLASGYRVRGTVRRSPGDYPWLTGLPGARERLELVTADLLREGSFGHAVEGCRHVMHTASPYALDVRDPERDLLEPALHGTRQVLEASLASGSVERVVLTSSIAAVTDEPRSGHTYTEEDWNERSSLARNPYHYAKTMAERAAWEFMERRKPGFDLVAINPTLVTGPSLGPSLNTSNAMLRDILSGVYPALMDMNWGFVDVRDTARAHILAMEIPEASGRYLCTAGEMTMKELVGLLRENGYGRYPLPRADLSGRAGTALMKLLSRTQPRHIGTFIRTHIGRTIRVGSEKITRELGMRFTPPEESILEALEDMIRQGHLPDRRG
ncbi:SDR family oxidoreductase [Chlorobium sp. N1]|uniref:SDR family oxidoreductase n=1 Tax=Chlorobium sp. N1 TaxID=2491138 RepID=UPI00103CEDD2|nr:SDR family oxidoreductase [Chlorobium sp. N1]TCD46971.1 NAD-dependent epimerase/dehydratase family protein [Chlorobium sp. N1]